MTGNFYCVPSSCAKVVYREYLPPVVRWRYSGEDWQEIEADSYSIDRQPGQCFTRYRLIGTYANANTRVASCGRRYDFSASFDGKFIQIIVYYSAANGSDVFGYDL